MDQKKLNAISTIHRALGMIEGVACAVSETAGATLIAAVGMIDEAVEEAVKDG